MTAQPSPIDVFGEDELEEELDAQLSKEEREEHDFLTRVWRTYERESRELADGLGRDDFPPLQLRQPPAPLPPLTVVTQVDEEQPDSTTPDPEPTTAPVAAPPPAEPTPEETSMDVAKRGEACLAAARELAVDGHRPSMVEIGALAGVTASAEDVLRGMVRRSLEPYRRRGILDWGRARSGGLFFLLDGGVAPPKAQKKPSPVQKKPSAPPRPEPKALRPAPPASNDPIVDQLRARRTELLAQVDRLNLAIDALEAG